MKKIFILFLGLALFGCKDDVVTTPSKSTPVYTIDLDELFDRTWYDPEPREWVAPEFQLTAAGVYADPTYGNGTWIWEDEDNHIMRCDRNGEFLLRVIEVTNEDFKFKLHQPILENPDWDAIPNSEYKSTK
jgi:hypothetical protein